MTSLLINARFMTRPMAGVDRVGWEMTRALIALQEDAGDTALRIRLAAPHAAMPEDRPSHPSQTHLDHIGRLPGQAWEQLELPWLEPDAWLYSPCNIGPILRRKQILTLHDAQIYSEPTAYTPVFRIWNKILIPRLARRAEIITTVSNFSKMQLEQFGVVPPGKSHVIHNGGDHILRIETDKTTLDRYGLTPHGYFLAVGSRSPHKNLALLLKAAEARPPNEPPLVVAGGGDARVFAHAGIQPGPATRLLGRVTDPELKALYEGALAFLFPSRTEGFGLPPLEAMFCGCPVIASTGGAVPEVCGDAVCYVNPMHQQAWTQALIRFAQDTEVRRRLGDAGMRRARLFTWEQAASELIRTLRHWTQAERSMEPD